MNNIFTLCINYINNIENKCVKYLTIFRHNIIFTSYKQMKWVNSYSNEDYRMEHFDEFLEKKGYSKGISLAYKEALWYHYLIPNAKFIYKSSELDM